MIKKENKEFLKLILAIVIPVAMQNLIAMTLNMADTVMISHLGDATIAAVGLVNQFLYFFIVTIFGISSGSAIFMSQYYGKGDKDNLNKIYAIMMVIVIAISLIFSIFASIFKAELLAILSPEIEVQFKADIYLSIIIFTFVITGISFAINSTYRSIGDAKTPVKISIISFLTNIVLNYILINGKIGFPVLGVAGAAYATLIARLLEFGLLFYMARKSEIFGFKIKYLKLVNISFIKRYSSVAFPVILAEALWSLSQLLFAVIYARIGKQATAAVHVTNTVQNVFYLFSNSLCAAASVIIGQLIGSYNRDKAIRYSRKFIKLAISIGIVSALFLMFFPDYLLLLYRNLDRTLEMTSRRLLIIRGIFIGFRFVNAILIIGIFRGGGDSRLPLILEMITIWLYAIPAALISTMILNLPIEYVFTIVSMEEVIKMILILPRYFSKKWLRDITQ
ncbi:MAG: MATE family efflux transporter [Tissierellia bacterium]|nr:MATE family efflux transporter [Tissierellia bacterium]